MPILCLIVFSLMAAFALLLPSIMFFIENLGVSKSLATKTLACYSIAQFVAGPFLGRISDRIGRILTLRVGLMMALAAYGVLAFFTDTIQLMFLGLVLAGIGSGGVAVAFAAVTDITSVQNRARGMGMVGAAIGLAFTIGPAAGAVLSSSDAVHATIASPAKASICILLIGLLSSHWLPAMLGRPNSPSRTARARRLDLAGLKLVFGNALLFNIELLMLVFTVALALMEPIIPYLIRDRYQWGPQEMGYLFGFAGMVVVIVQAGLVGRLSARFGEAKLLASGVLSMGIGLACLAWAPMPVFVIIALMFTSIGGALFNTSAFAIASKNASEQDRGLVLGAVQSMQSLGRSGGPLVSGAMYQLLAILPLMIGIGAMVLSLVWVRLLQFWR